MIVKYGQGFEVAEPLDMRDKVDALQNELSKMPQYEPVTEHIFHGGMYCRKVFREAGVLVVGKVHLFEHFYMIVSGSVIITTDEGVVTIEGPELICSKPGTKRAVYALTDTTCMTFHRTDATTVDDAETELVESDPDGQYLPGNVVKDNRIEVTS